MTTTKAVPLARQIAEKLYGHDKVWWQHQENAERIITKRLAPVVEALEWAKNELAHELDETACCTRHCRSCKAKHSNPQWHKWWDEGYDPVPAALRLLKGD